MTTVPGFNLLIQQSGIVREVTQSSSTPHPEGGQASVQGANEEARKTVVQELEEPEKLKAKKEKEKNQDEANKKVVKKKKKKESSEENNLDSTGRLLDTIA